MTGAELLSDMIVGFRDDVDDVLRAAIALKREPAITLVCGHDEEEVKSKLRQYPGDAIAMASEIVPHVPSSVKLKLRERPPRINIMCQPSLHAYIDFSLRHKDCKPVELVRLLSAYYPDIGQVMARKDELSLKYFHLHMEVLRENEKLRAHTRPRPAGNLMYVEISPEHKVVDLYIEWLIRRVSDRASIVKVRGDYYLANAHCLGYNVLVKKDLSR
jgi:hypothetical protein